MGVESALYNYLVNESTVSNVVGAKVFAHAVHEGTDVPYVVITRISRADFDHLAGASGLAQSRMQVDSYAATAEVAIALAEAVRLLLHGFRGTMGAEALPVRYSSIGEHQSEYQPPHDATSVGVHHIRQEYSVTHTETAPTF